MRNMLLGALLCVVSTGLLVADTSPKAKPVTVPFELLKSGHMAVQVKVNGKGPYLLIFDTGAPTSLISTRVAREAKLEMKGPGLPGFGPVGEAKLQSLEVGEQKTENVPAIVMDHPVVKLIGEKLGKPIEGLVGFPFFARFKMTLDYEKRTMTLVPSGYKPEDVMTAMTMMMLRGPAKKVLAPAAQWGLMATKEVGDEEAGMDVKGVVPGGAADRAGLERGDRLLTLDGRWTDNQQDLYEAASHVKPGTTVVVKVRRRGKEIELKVTPTRGL